MDSFTDRTRLSNSSVPEVGEVSPSGSCSGVFATIITAAEAFPPLLLLLLLVVMVVVLASTKPVYAMVEVVVALLADDGVVVTAVADDAEGPREFERLSLL